MGMKYPEELEFVEQSSLVGRMLVATPNLNESIFERSLVFICAHDSYGAVGVIFNKPSSSITTKGILAKYDVKKRSKINRKYTIYLGGPVDESKLFILSADADQKKSFDQNSRLTLYTNAEVFLLDVVSGKNNSSFIACNGVCGWGPKQLEDEVNENSWIVTNVDFKTIFKGKSANKWDKIIKKLGIKNPDRLVPYSGNA